MISQAQAPRRASRWKGKLIGAALVAAGIGVVVFIASLPSPHVAPPPVEAVPVNVTVQAVEPLAQLADTFQLTGVVQPRSVVEVAAEAAGRVEAYGKRKREARGSRRMFPVASAIMEGERVSAGDPLVILNSQLLQARYDRSAAQYEHQEQEYQRIAGLYERGSAPPTELRQARLSRDVTKADLDEATRSLERATVVAPIDGILNDWKVELGEYAVPGTSVAEIVDIDQVKVNVDVPERDVGNLSIGRQAEITTLDSSATSVTGTITYINALADEATRTTRIEVSVDNLVPASQVEADATGNEYRLRSGQIVKARLTRRVLDNVMMIPLAGVIPLEDGKEVYVVRNGKAERRKVELGFIRGRDVQILSGLAPGEQLIVAGHRMVSPGQPVNVVGASAGGSDGASDGMSNAGMSTSTPASTSSEANEGTSP